MPDQQLAKYKLLEEVGQGGMAVVYRGVDTTLNREVAVKILHPHLAKEDESKKRFHREAQAVAKLRHQNILEIYDYSGMDSQQSFIVTEFIEGETLKTFLARHPISHPEIAAMIVHQVCSALAHAHSLSVIHRDIKPENIMIRHDGRLKLMDFGIAQMVDLRKLTVTGQLLGSPAYMSPELVNGQPVDFRSDVFSVGTLLYQLTTASMPFDGRNPHEVMRRIAEGRFLPPEAVNPVVGVQMGQIIRKALAGDPEQRYSTVDDLMAHLSTFLDDVGIDDVEAELAAYFRDPAEYSRELQQRLVAALLQNGKNALDQKRKAVALKSFDRLLCLDPANGEVRGILDRMSTQRRWFQVLSSIVVVCVVVCGIYALSLLWPADNGSTAMSRTRADRRATVAPGKPQRSTVGIVDGPVTSPDATADITPVPSPLSHDAAGPDTAVTQIPAHSVRRRGVRKRTARRSPPTDGKRIEIIPTPKAVTVWLDNEKLGPYGPDLRYVSIASTPARLVLRNDACCFERALVIDDNTPQKLFIRLPWKPGRVRVKIKPIVDNASVVVGRMVARVGQLVEIPIPSYSDNGRTDVQATVSAPGFTSWSQSVSVKANETTTLTATLSRRQP